MVFGLFKKNVYADVIFKGGKIYTLDPDSPRAEAVACKDGRIIAVGAADDMEEITGKNTNIIDLAGCSMLPGFIEAYGHPVLQAFNDVCLMLYDDAPRDQVLENLAEYIKNNPNNRGYLGYGFNTDFVVNKPEDEMRAVLDGVCADKPVALLDISGFYGWFNTKAMELVKTVIAEEGEAAPKIITLSYILHILSPIDFDRLQRSIVKLAAEYSGKGYTMMFDCGSPDYLHSVYQDMIVEMLQSDMLKQRFIGSFLVVRNVASDYIVKKLMQKSTSCAEIEEYVNCRILKLVINANATPNTLTSTSVTYDLLKILAIQASDRGFNFHIDTIGKEALSETFEAVFLARAAGYKKNHFVVAHFDSLTQEEKTGLLLDNELCESSSTLGDFNKRYSGTEDAKDVMDAIDKLTMDAAVTLGISDDYGSIENGKRADFVIFKDDPLDCNLPRFRDLPASMTVIGGNIVYEAGTDGYEKWLETLRFRQELDENEDEDGEDERIE